MKTAKLPITERKVVAWVRNLHGWITKPTIATMNPPRRRVINWGKIPARSIPVDTVLRHVDKYLTSNKSEANKERSSTACGSVLVSLNALQHEDWVPIDKSESIISIDAIIIGA
jgi:hypothetical protein